MDNKTFNEQYQKAVDAARTVEQTEPRAKSVRYDATSRRVVVELENGATFIFPPDLLQGLGQASAEQLANVRLAPRGAALWWDDLDAQFSLPALMMGIFGNKAWMAELGREGGVTKATKAIVKPTAVRHLGLTKR